MNNPDSKETELPKKALKKIRALCKGNGVKADSIQIKNARGNVIECEAITHIEIHPEITEERKNGRHNIGEVVENPALIQKSIQEFTSKILGSQDSRKELAQILLDRPDKGFALHAEYFELENLKRHYSFHQACQTCQGQGNTACGHCGGQRREQCNQCHGRTMVPCKYCHGGGLIQGADGKQIQCNRCFGQRQTSCGFCQKTGSITCRQCKGSGTKTCGGCRGAAFFTHITHVTPKIKTLFEIDRSALPHPVVKIFEDQGPKIAERGHIKLTAEQVKREDGGLAIQYNLVFPYGDLEISINGKPLKTHLFGYKGKMLKLPDFLDSIVQPYILLLQKAAHGKDSVAKNINKASKARFVSQALIFCLSMTPKKATLSLKKKFPMGASNQLIKDTITIANQALSQITRKSRMSGLFIAMGIVAFIDSVYFMGSVRNLLNPVIAGITDMLLIAAGGYLGNMIMNILAQRPLEQALGKLLPKKKRSKFKPKTQNKIWLSYLASAGVLFLVLIITSLLGFTTPGWFPF